MTTYTVSWSMSFDDDDADGPRDAAQQAGGWIEDAVRNGRDGASVLVVRDEDDNHLGTFDEFGHGEEIKR